jgi:hypothetical protein
MKKKYRMEKNEIWQEKKNKKKYLIMEVEEVLQEVHERNVNTKKKKMGEAVVEVQQKNHDKRKKKKKKRKKKKKNTLA